jgi:hypothetical protein
MSGSLQRQPTGTQNLFPPPLSQNHARHNQHHRRPKSLRDRFPKANPSPGHRAERDKIVEQQHLAGRPMFQRCVPKRIGHHAAGHQAVRLHENQICPPNQTADGHFGQGQRQLHCAGTPHCMRAYFCARKDRPQRPALPSIGGPKHTGREPQKFTTPITGSEPQRRPVQDQDTGHR